MADRVTIYTIADVRAYYVPGLLVPAAEIGTIREVTPAEVLAHHAVAALVAERDRLQAMLDAERGLKGLPGWTYSGYAWTCDPGYGPSLQAIRERDVWAQWRWSGPAGSHGITRSAIEAMEAAACAAKEAT